jgi:release factor glutamine methyltransferase
MNKDELFHKLSAKLENQIHFLEDKPEETISSTLNALWLKAAGTPVSAEKAVNLSLPDLTEKQQKYLNELIQLRIENTPLAHITGRQNFMGVELISDKRALIPRKETELLGKKALEISMQIEPNSEGNIYVLDVCCGAGNLGLAVAHHNPKCIVYSSDISHEAVDLTQENIDLLKLNQRVQVKQGDMISAYDTEENYGKFDLIICNPPYIFSSNVPKMNEEISRNEPTAAFDGGMLGIKIIQSLVKEAPKYLKSKAWLTFEVGAGQGQFIIQLCERTGVFSSIDTVLDASGRIRAIVAQKI